MTQFHDVIAVALVAGALALPSAALAEIDHFFDYRFGVSHADSGAGAGGARTHALYEGRYTTRLSHQTDSGVRFRFDLTIAVGNITDRHPPETHPGTRRGNSISIDVTQ